MPAQHTSLKQMIKRSLAMVLVPFLVAFYPAAAFAAENTTTDGATAPAAQQTDTTTPPQGPQTPTGADASTYVYNESTGKWENDHYIWDPVTHKTTSKDSTPYTYDPTTKTWSTTDWQYDAPSGTYVPVQETVDNNTTASIDNTVTQQAISGDATVSANTTAGNATTGSATDIANVINMLQSSLGAAGAGQVATFNTNIQGDVSGNLYIDPGAIMQSQANTTNSGSLQSAGGIQVNNQNNGSINNAILLNATSGNASVVANTTAGNATSGDASAIVNVVNFLNTAIAANQSFIGAINIQGDLSGDILMPDGLLDRLLASNNTTASSAASSNGSTANSTNITNDVTATAQSGNATVTGNTSAGNATTGSARNTLTVLNMTGSNIIGSNALLVFVNVMGTWTGLIVNAPGSNTALLGGGIDTGSAVTTAQSPTFSNVDNDTHSTITNTITANATTGDATVSHNTTAGNATSGNATTAINLANLVNNNFGLSNWFGILFINVLGNWTGSFGFGSPSGSNQPTNAGTSAGNTAVFSFQSSQALSGKPATARGTGTVSAGANLAAEAAQAEQSAVLGTKTPTPVVDSGQYANTTIRNYHSLLILLAGLAVGLTVLGVDKFIVGRRS